MVLGKKFLASFRLSTAARWSYGLETDPSRIIWYVLCLGQQHSKDLVQIWGTCVYIRQLDVCRMVVSEEI